MDNDYVKENKEKHREKSSLGERQQFWRRLLAPYNIKSAQERKRYRLREERIYVHFFPHILKFPKSLEGNPTILDSESLTIRMVRRHTPQNRVGLRNFGVLRISEFGRIKSSHFRNLAESFRYKIRINSGWIAILRNRFRNFVRLSVPLSFGNSCIPWRAQRIPTSCRVPGTRSRRQASSRGCTKSAGRWLGATELWLRFALFAASCESARTIIQA